MLDPATFTHDPSPEEKEKRFFYIYFFVAQCYGNSRQWPQLILTSIGSAWNYDYLCFEGFALVLWEAEIG